MANRTTLGNWLQWMERPLQTSTSRDRGYLVEQANKLRRIFYDLYREFEIEVDVEECFKIQDFGHCAQCQDDTKGITLPAYMNTVEAAWAYGQPLDLYSKWREYKTGLKLSSDCLRAVYDMPGRYATERDICPAGILACVQILARSTDDAGKEIKVVYRTADGTRTEYVKMLKDGYKRLEMMASDIVEVVLPTNLTGPVVIAQDRGADGIRILSEYSPFEHVPSYRRVKVTGVCEDEILVVRASRQYADVFNNDDIVETDNRIAVENGARYLFYSESGTGTDLMQKATYHYALMKDALQGMNSRDIGISKDGDFLHGPPVRRSRLHAFRRSHTIR